MKMMKKMINMRLGSLIVMMISVIMVMQLGLVKGFKDFEVGGALNWRVPDGNDTSFYNQWASSKRFHVGDSLHFKYQNDSVLVVDKYGYYHCEISNARASFTDGNTYFKLENPGLIYFISGTVDHCRSGQRLIVDVMSKHSSPLAPPPESLSPESPATASAPGDTHGTHSLGLQLAPMTWVAALLGLVATSLFLV